MLTWNSEKTKRLPRSADCSDGQVHPIDYTITQDNPKLTGDQRHHGYLPVKSGWSAIIVPPKGEPFREYVQLFHDNLQEIVSGLVEPDPRAINNRTESFSDIFNPGVAGTRPRTLAAQPFAVNDRSMAYSAYTYGDSSTTLVRLEVSALGTSIDVSTPIYTPPSAPRSPRSDG